MKITIDIGGTSTRVGLLESNEILKIEAFDTDPNDFWKNLNQIKDIIALWNIDIDSIGVAMPGPLDIKKGIVLNTPNLPSWKNLEIRKILQKEFNVENVKINNDANAAALGQYIIRGSVEQNLLYFTFSTGIGGGWVLDGKVFEGFNGNALEVANAIPKIKAENPFKSGVEYIASGANIYKQINLKGYNFNEASELLTEYNKGTDQIIIDYMDDVSDKIAEFLATAINFINPEVIVIGGSVAMNNQEWFKTIFEKVWFLTTDFINYKTKIEFATNLTNATLIGAGGL